MHNIEKDKLDKDANRDPLTGAPGAHPVGVGVGATGGGAAGAAIGTAVAGPVGTAVGLVIGAVAGGLAGKGVAESIDPTAEDAYWRENHSTQPFAKDRPYDDYAPAYRTGYVGFGQHYKEGARFEDAEPLLREHYESGTSSLDDTGLEGATDDAVSTSVDRTDLNRAKPLPWKEARPAAEAAWKRVERGEVVR